MDRQAFFNKTVELARKQGRRCLSKEGGYAYKNAGRCCFIGFHIPNGHPAGKSGKGVANGLFLDFPDLKTLWSADYADEPFLSSLQDIHDACKPKDWENKFKEFAERWELEYNV